MSRGPRQRTTIRLEVSRLRAAVIVAAIVSATVVASGGARNSPNSTGLIAFSAPRAPAASHIYVIKADGTGRRQLISGATSESCPAWSPDGKRIAASVRTGRSWIEVIGLSGQRMWRIAATGCPAWSPDGSQLAFVRETGPEAGALYVVGANGRGSRKLADGDADLRGRPAWSPDGKEIAYKSICDRGFDPKCGLAITVLRVDGTDRRLLPVKPDTTWCTADCHLYASDMTWAPGKEIAVLMVCCDLYPEKLYSVRPDGSGQWLLSGKLKDVYTPAWSPDGSRIAFRNEDPPPKATWVANADASGLRRIRREVFDPAWSPDGRQLACSGDDGGIYIVNADRGAARLLVRHGSNPAWQPNR